MIPKDRFLFFCFSLFLSFLGGLARGGEVRIPGDHSTLQAAIDAAKPGDTVLVGPGCYSGPIRLKVNVRVRSLGDDRPGEISFGGKSVFERTLRTLIDAGGKNTQPVVTGADGAVLDGFTVTGLGKVDHHKPGHAHAVECRGVSPQILNNLVIHNGSTGIGSHNRGKRLAAALIQGNFVVGNEGIGIGNNQESGALILDNVVCHNHEAGIGSRNGAKPVVIGNIVFKNGFGYPQGPEKNPVTGGVFWPGIGARDGARPYIAGNEVYGNAMAGIGSSKAYPTIVSNHVHHNRLTGIGLTERSRALVMGNRSHDNGRPGIGVVNSLALLVENVIGFNGKNAGIGILDGSRVLARGNRISGAGTAGFGVINATALLVENEILRAGTAGVMVTGSLPVTLEGNRILRSGTVGVLASGYRLNLKKNIITDSAHHGVLVHASAGLVVVEGNTIRGNGKRGGAGIFAPHPEQIRLGKNEVKENGRLGDVVIGGRKKDKKRK
ncbi:MAG: right-handed parallel beta-helix repeat-containing protein [Planctomycetota bacterium]|jgi:hypothetical protein